MKHITQPVSPDEYDEAVRRDPMVSALSATGDLRTGLQLLADAAEDRLRSIAWMAACQHGRAELDKMAASTEGHIGRMSESRRGGPERLLQALEDRV